MGWNGVGFWSFGSYLIFVTGTAGGTLRLLRNKGGFVFEDVSVEAGLLPISATAVGLAVGDVNNDGWDDIFVNSFEPGGGVPGSGFIHPNQLYINQGDGTFTEEGGERGGVSGARGRRRRPHTCAAHDSAQQELARRVGVEASRDDLAASRVGCVVDDGWNEWILGQ